MKLINRKGGTKRGGSDLREETIIDCCKLNIMGILNKVERDGRCEGVGNKERLIYTGRMVNVTESSSPSWPN